MKKEYAIVNNNREYITYKTYGSLDSFYIPLFTKDEGKKEIEMYFRNKGYSVKKMKL